jgi:hypothetical protein
MGHLVGILAPVGGHKLAHLECEEFLLKDQFAENYQLLQPFQALIMLMKEQARLAPPASRLRRWGRKREYVTSGIWSRSVPSRAGRLADADGH